MSEVFELGDEPSGVRFIVSAAVPVSAQVVVGLVAFQHPVGRNQHRVRDGDLGPALISQCSDTKSATDYTSFAKRQVP
jgi:hypothetical protein